MQGPNVRDILESNRSVAALNRDTEIKIAEMGKAGTLALVDLRTVPRAEWDKWIDFDVVVPENVQSFLELRRDAVGQDALLLGDVGDSEAQAVEEFYGVTEPYYIEVSPTLRSTGRAWAYIPAAAPYLSGFTLAKE